MPNVLIALTGTSPAVLTETVWALAHQPGEPVIPDIIVVLTTTKGADELRKQLFGPDQLWFTLRQQLLGPGHAQDARLDFADSPSCIKVFEQRLPNGDRRLLERLDTLEETQAAGDSMVREVWNWVGRPDHRIYASLSGGFKTMSALLYATMTALGRLNDRALHVLVEPPFDGGTAPMFYWPEQPQQALAAKFDGSRHDGTPYKKGDTFLASHAADKLVLTDVPFPALSRLFGDYGFKQPPTFSALIERCREQSEEMAPAASADESEAGVQTLNLDSAKFTAWINGEVIPLEPALFEMLRFHALAVQQGIVMVSSDYATQAYHEYLLALLANTPPHYTTLKEQAESLRLDLATKTQDPSFKMEFYTKALSRLRTYLRGHASKSAKLLGDALPYGKVRRSLEVSRDALTFS